MLLGNYAAIVCAGNLRAAVDEGYVLCIIIVLVIVKRIL